MDRMLLSQKNEVAGHQAYFAKSKVTRCHIATLLLLVSAFFIGWKAARKQWSGKIMQQVVEVGTLALLNSFKKTLVALFRQ